jgi:hypothetical protein
VSAPVSYSRRNWEIFPGDKFEHPPAAIFEVQYHQKCASTSSFLDIPPSQVLVQVDIHIKANLPLGFPKKKSLCASCFSCGPFIAMLRRFSNIGI